LQDTPEEHTTRFLGLGSHNPSYERKIPRSGGANVWIPKEFQEKSRFIPDKNLLVVVMDGKKILGKLRLDDISRVG
jgi:hypothetical protein